ncbi:hypothetical protein QUF76_05505 [Desulfobacterales bacterium HSG16]|nr:hypothetical protein [Desulfobacterales bacterium HSG16]
MKKQNAYTIADEIFMDALKVIDNNFKDIQYAIVGGGAVQVYVSSVTMKHAGLKAVNEINGLSLMLRRTGDIDLSFDSDLAGILKLFNVIIAQKAKKYLYHSFEKRFVMQNGMCRFNLNYQTEPEDLKDISSYYHDIIHSAISVPLNDKNRVLNLKLARPEYLVVSKLTRIKPKDQVDIALLLKAAELDGYPFDTEEVRSILKSVKKEEGYDILLELMDNG